MGKNRPGINLLAYVHLRNIYGSTGAGRTARQVVEHLSRYNDIDLRILADERDRAHILPLVGKPWTDFRYVTFPDDTSKQQFRWTLRNNPKAEYFWNEADIVYCTGESYVPTHSARLVVTCHDAAYFETQGHRHDLPFWKTRLKWKILYRVLEKHADMIHTVSQFSAERLAYHFPALASRIRPVHNGVTELFFAPVTPEGEAYLRAQQLQDRTYLLVPGGLHFRKNAELILKAIPLLLQRFPDLAIVVAGHSSGIYPQRAQAFGTRVHLLGFVTDEALRALYGGAAVVWFPSHYEGFGLPVVEAMACGAPVVASNTTSIPEIAGEAALLRDPQNVMAHVSAISMLLTDEHARGEFSHKGKARAQLFSWSRSSAELRDHFLSLL